MEKISKRQQGPRLKWRGGLGLCLVALLPAASALAQSKPLPTDRGRVTVASIPDPYGGPKLKVLRTDCNTPLRAGTAWIWEKQRQEEPASYYVSLREKGFNAVRMILFDVWEMEAYKPSATFTPTDWNDPVYRTRQLARMERAVNYASANGMYVIINAHNKIPNYNEGYVNALWTVVAPHFANRTHVLYEASNEPMEGIGNNGSMTPNASDNPSKHPRIQALRRTFNIIRKAAPLTHVMILTPSGINDYATGTGLGNLAAAFAAMPGVAVDWTKTSVAYHLYNNDVAYGAANKAANLRNLHSRYPGWPSENAFPPGDIPKAIGLDNWRSPSFPGDTYVNQTCERLGLGWSMWFINGQEQLDTNFPILWADAVAKGWTWKPDNAADEGAWQPLFNGTNLSGWTVQCKPKDQGKSFWQVDAGTILCDSLGRPDHDYCWLVSDKEYGDFELRLKFQAYTHSPGNSGVQFRSRYDKDDQGGWLNGPQVDIHPPASQSWRTGLIYDETRGEQRWVSPSLPNWKIGPEHKLAGHVFKTANEGDGWNDLVLTARGNHIKTVVNGVVCTDWDGAGTLDNAAHRAKNVGSKGQFALQLHVKDQLRIRFKEIVIRELKGSVAGGVSVTRGHPPADATENGLVIVAADAHAPSANGTSVSNGWVTVMPAEFPGAINNPLKGFRDYKKDGYGLLKRQYIQWNDIEVSADDTVERIIAHTTKITQIKGKRFEELNIKLVPRVYLDWDGSPGKQYWPADLKTFDYDSPAFQERLRRLITKLGQAWDKDPRIFAVQMGLIGHFGEHHHPAPTAEQRRLLVEAFQKAFKNKPVLVRHHDTEFMQAGFGIYYDTFANLSREPPAGPKEQFPWQATYRYGDHWKRALVEGEVEYNWQQRRESAKPEETFGRTPDETMKVPAYRRYMIDKIRRYHASYLGWISDYDTANGEVLAGAAELQSVFGYRFVLDAASYPCTVAPGKKLTVKLAVRNTGSAPFYLDWPVAVGLLDPATKKPVWSAPLSGVDIRTWLPGEAWDSAVFAYRRPAVSYQDKGQVMLPQDIKPGSYILALAILDRQGGLMPSARFAIENYFRGGWHPLGTIGIGTAAKQVALDKATFDSPAFDDSLYYKVPERVHLKL